MANNQKMKAFVRYDNTGRIIPGSLVLRRNKPSSPGWVQTQAYECCDPYLLQTTTSTTTVA